LKYLTRKQTANNNSKKTMFL